MSNAPDPHETQAYPASDPHLTRPAPDTPHDGSESLLKPGDVIPGYEILGVLGRGGMGVVYKARQTALDRLVAVKTVVLGQFARADLVARFEQEARTVARFRHPNIVTAYDFGRHEGRLFFVMELLEGETLEDYVARHGRIDEAAAWGFVRQAAAGLAHAAQLSVVHRDVKPANLFLVEPPAGSTLPGGLPMVKVTDFGLVLLAADAAAARLTAAGMTLGTPLYMAPEQITGGELDHRTDIYALGATAFHLLDGQPPFDSDTLWQLLADKTKGDLPRLGELAAKVSQASIELIAAMMAHDPAARLSSYEELLRRIDLLALSPQRSGALAEAKTRPVPAAVSTKSAPVSGRSRRYVAALAAILVLASIGVTAWRWWPTLFHATPPRPTFVPSDKAQSLFDGTSLNGWQILSGGWTPAQDADKASVLSGRGVIRRSLPPWTHHRLSFGIDLNKAASVDVLFGLTSADREAPAGLVLRIASDGAQLGTRSRDGGEVRPDGPFLKTSGTADGDGGPVYREVTLERQGRDWWVYYDRKLIGTHPIGEGELQEFRLAVESGTALFDTIEVVELVSP
jgi:serine/threonine protein kinase